jgi:hypothetical protein
VASVKLCAWCVDIHMAWRARVLAACRWLGCRSGSIRPDRLVHMVETSYRRFHPVANGRVRSDLHARERRVDPPGSIGAPGPPPATRYRVCAGCAPGARVDEGRTRVQFLASAQKSALKNWHLEAATRGGLRLFSGTQTMPLTPRRSGAAPH